MEMRSEMHVSDQKSSNRMTAEWDNSNVDSTLFCDWEPRPLEREAALDVIDIMVTLVFDVGMWARVTARAADVATTLELSCSRCDCM